ncbi:MAG: di-trans,poly-cis-decaprenylcistransferase [Gammaproteobacteria bacterium]|nr:MAG: di-trans,poly-cis-decaprenylcistransferase [Gammaproteobacteria bacterium]RLA15247.1 MAG: di-trans,poly-cis-decaprenylcistransferase [Gammaproteobacteria bacterium]
MSPASDSHRSLIVAPLQHVAAVMDGNGRWAQQRGLSRGDGHLQGAVAARKMVESSLRAKIPYLTLFAFSSENWNRPADEVSLLMGLFVQQLQAELPGLLEQNIRLQVVGSRQRFPAELVECIDQVETETASGAALSLYIAADYGGRWDITQAAQNLAYQVRDGELDPELIDEETLAKALALSSAPDPDLLIRTGGECRISNFLLWQCAYSELYFTDICWPDFDAEEFGRALGWYAQRLRRFGRIPGVDVAGQEVLQKEQRQ